MSDTPNTAEILDNLSTVTIGDVRELCAALDAAREQVAERKFHTKDEWWGLICQRDEAESRIAAALALHPDLADIWPDMYRALTEGTSQ